MQCDFRFQNTQPLSKCEINRMSSNDGVNAKESKGLAGVANWEYRDLRYGGLIVSCAQPQRALSPGQYAVFYRYKVIRKLIKRTREKMINNYD